MRSTRDKHKVSPLRSASQAPRRSGRDDIIVVLHVLSSSSNVASLNIRYPLPQTAFEQAVLDAIRKLNLKGVSKVNVQGIRRESQ